MLQSAFLALELVSSDQQRLECV